MQMEHVQGGLRLFLHLAAADEETVLVFPPSHDDVLSYGELFEHPHPPHHNGDSSLDGVSWLVELHDLTFQHDLALEGAVWVYAGQDAQQGGLASAKFPQYDVDCACLDVQREVVQGCDIGVGFGKASELEEKRGGHDLER